MNEWTTNKRVYQTFNKSSARKTFTFSFQVDYLLIMSKKKLTWIVDGELIQKARMEVISSRTFFQVV